MPMLLAVKKPMRLSAIFTAIAMIFFALSAHVSTAAPSANLVQAELLADVAAIKPGEPFTAGVHFRIENGWHIYWKNPGDSGLPTRVRWKLPPGFKGGELEFPLPQRIVLPGDIINYGYENEVMLMARITPPKDLTVGTNIELAADVSWLVCKESCVMGKAPLRLSLPVAGKAEPANRDAFEKWAKRLPAPAEKLSGIGIETKPLDLRSGKGDSEIVVTLANMTERAIPARVENLEVKVSNPQKVEHGTRYLLSATVFPGQRVSAKELEVLIGPYRVNVPIVGAAGPATAPASP